MNSRPDHHQKPILNGNIFTLIFQPLTIIKMTLPNKIIIVHMNIFFIGLPKKLHNPRSLHFPSRHIKPIAIQSTPQ